MNDHVQTAIRWRPPMPNRDVCIEKVSSKVLSFGPQFRPYLFDHVCDSSAAAAGGDSQAEVYNVLVKPLIDRAFEGYNCTFLAIGQTGSGKTFTVGFDQSVNSEHSGMTARVLQSIFSYQNAEQVKVLISFIEIYNEKAFDLLAENQQEPFYNKENRLNEPTKMSIKSENDVLSILAQASKRRHIRNTKMNSVSSRSHAVFTIYLGIKHAEMDIRESVINIVDLAGSEGFGKTGNALGSKAHFEGKFINESLAAFKRVINAMSSGQSHIPYRDTVITKFLKEALNPQSYLTLLGCVSPYQNDYGETLSTLIFVSEAKQLKRTPQLNAVISDFQKSKTPVKAILRTPIATTLNTFKRPASMSTGIPNKRSYPFSKIMSVPPKKLSFAANSSESHRFERSSVPSSLASSSTSKKTVAFNRQKQMDLMMGNRPKAATNLFPMPLTPSRRLIENLLNNKTDDTNESINFLDASTSSALEINSSNHHRFSSLPLPSSSSSNDETKSRLGKIMNLLAGPALQLLTSEVEKRMTENSDPKLRSNQIMESIHMVLNKFLMQNASTESSPPKNRTVELSPLVEKSNEGGMAIASTSKQAETIANEQLLVKKRSSSFIAIDVNHADKQIVVEVLAPIATNDTLPLAPPPPIPTPTSSSFVMMDYKENPNRSDNNVNIGFQLANPFEAEWKISSIEKQESQLFQPFTENTVDQTVSKDEVDGTMNKSYEMPLGDLVTVQITPIADKQNPIETDRTPIGKIRLRRTMDSMMNACPADAVDDIPAYEIVMVNKDRIAPVKKVRFGPIENITMNTSGGLALPSGGVFENASIAGKAHPAYQAYPLHVNNEIASKTTARDHRFPMAPNMILQRINVLQEYNRNIAMQNVARLAVKNLQMAQRSGNQHANVSKSRSTAIIKNVLDILNSGTLKDLTLLATIGPKTAETIFQNRVERGPFPCIESLLRIPYWSKKKHRRFLELNLQC